MRDSTPLHDRHEQFVADEAARRAAVAGRADRPGAAVGVRGAGGLEWLDYGPVPVDAEPLRIVATYGSVEAEYAAIRRGAGFLDAAHRGTIVVRGTDRAAFLNRMVTQQLADLAPGAARPSFWLNRKGRIDADLLIAHLPEEEAAPAEFWIDVDRHHAASVVASLCTFVFADDVAIEDVTESTHRVAVHGSAAAKVLADAADPEVGSMRDRSAGRTRIAGTSVTVVRRDQCGVAGFELAMDVASAGTVWDALLAASATRTGVRPIGWHAFNIARIESGTPLFNVDFDTTSLPHETGVLRDRVSFVKGCYLGQEVVARMESLGKPKQTLVGLRIERSAEGDVLPEAGSTVCTIESGADASVPSTGPAVGAVTSSTLSPMLAAAPIALAMVRTAHCAPGTRLFVFGEGARAVATVGPLQAWGRSADAQGVGP